MGFDTVLKKHFAGCVLALLAAAAYLQALGISALVSSALAPSSKSLAGASVHVATASPPRAAEDHATSALAILERNPFDSVTPRPLDAPRGSGNGGSMAASDLAHSENAPACEGFKALIVVAAPDSAWSMAALSAGASAATKLVRVGEELSGKTVQIVEWNRVVLSAGSSFCQIRMFEPGKAPAPPPLPRAGLGSLPTEIASKIQKVSATEFNVDRAVVEKILENQAEFMKSVRIVPEQENGKVVGIRLFGVRPDTLLGTLGLENGDRLESINGFDMASPEKVLEAYAHVRTADHLIVQVNRRGQSTNLDFNIK